jgi:hypothetical protein
MSWTCRVGRLVVDAKRISTGPKATGAAGAADEGGPCTAEITVVRESRSAFVTVPSCCAARADKSALTRATSAACSAACSRVFCDARRADSSR